MISVKWEYNAFMQYHELNLMIYARDHVIAELKEKNNGEYVCNYFIHKAYCDCLRFNAETLDKAKAHVEAVIAEDLKEIMHDVMDIILCIKAGNINES